MFDNPLALALRLRAVQVLVGSPLSMQAFRATATGISVERLKFDGRTRIDLIHSLPEKEALRVLRGRWADLAADIVRGKNPVDGLLWLRDDAVVEDHFLVERFAEAWTKLDSVWLTDEQQRPLLWAVSAEGLRRWARHGLPAQAGHTAPAAAAGAAATAAPPQPTPQQAREQREREASGLAQKVKAHTGFFPRADAAAAKKVGLRLGTWGISIARAVKPGQAAGEEGFRGGIASCNPKVDVLAGVPELLIVSATRESAERFAGHTPLGRSITRLREAGFAIRSNVAFDNKAGLSKVFNRSINRDVGSQIVVFAHDDIWLDDIWMVQRLHEALMRYDVVGVAGNRGCAVNQPAWAFPQRVGAWDQPENLVGCVAHCLSPKDRQGTDAKNTAKVPPVDHDRVSRYGPARASARLLDGVFIAARGSTLLQSGLRFDERFDFHHYDMDFCRSAEQLNLRVGVWPIALSHASGGAYNSPGWFAGFGSYVGKWQDDRIRA